MIMSVPKIKSFFSKTPEKMDEITEQIEIDGAREEENIAADYSLQDISIVMVTTQYNLMKLNKSIIHCYLTDHLFISNNTL